jgi:hypothetical protein
LKPAISTVSVDSHFCSPYVLSRWFPDVLVPHCDIPVLLLWFLTLSFPWFFLHFIHDCVSYLIWAVAIHDFSTWTA